MVLNCPVSSFINRLSGLVIPMPSARVSSLDFRTDHDSISPAAFNNPTDSTHGTTDGSKAKKMGPDNEFPENPRNRFRIIKLMVVTKWGGRFAAGKGSLG